VSENVLDIQLLARFLVKTERCNSILSGLDDATAEIEQQLSEREANPHSNGEDAPLGKLACSCPKRCDLCGDRKTVSNSLEATELTIVDPLSSLYASITQCLDELEAAFHHRLAALEALRLEQRLAELEQQGVIDMPPILSASKGLEVTPKAHR